FRPTSFLPLFAVASGPFLTGRFSDRSDFQNGFETVPGALACFSFFAFGSLAAFAGFSFFAGFSAFGRRSFFGLGSAFALSFLPKETSRFQNGTLGSSAFG